MRGKRGGKKTRENRDTCVRTTTCALLQTNEFQIYRCISVLLRQSVCPTAIYLDRFDPLSNSHGIVVSSLNIAISLAYQTGISKRKKYVRKRKRATIISYNTRISLNNGEKCITRSAGFRSWIIPAPLKSCYSSSINGYI